MIFDFCVVFNTFEILGALPQDTKFSNWYKLPFMKAVFRGEEGQLFEAVFPPLPYDPSPPFHVARGHAPETPVVCCEL